VPPVAFPASSRSHGVDCHETSVLRVANETPLPDGASSRAHHRRWQTGINDLQQETDPGDKPAPVHPSCGRPGYLHSMPRSAARCSMSQGSPENFRR